MGTSNWIALAYIVAPMGIVLLKATTEASAVAPPAAAWSTAPQWVRARDRQLLDQEVSDMQPDLVVAQDGTGNYTSLQAALNAARRPLKGKRHLVIHIRKGIYQEDVVISMNKILVVGDGEGVTVITGRRSRAAGVVSDDTAVMYAKGKHFMARDLTVENTAGKEAGAAVALRSDSMYSVFYRCELKGYEDTLLAKVNRQFYRECTISGTVDFIFGNAKAVFQNCVILARRPLRGKHNVITAQGRDDDRPAAGFSFQNCSVTSNEDLEGAETFLGRPWRNHSNVVFLQSFMDAIVHPRGWVTWDRADDRAPPTVYYGEYANRGPGANLSSRISWMHVLNTTQAATYTVSKFIRGDQWLNETGVPYLPGL